MKKVFNFIWLSCAFVFVMFVVLLLISLLYVIKTARFLLHRGIFVHIPPSPPPTSASAE